MRGLRAAHTRPAGTCFQRVGCYIRKTNRYKSCCLSLLLFCAVASSPSYTPSARSPYKSGTKRCEIITFLELVGCLRGALARSPLVGSTACRLLCLLHAEDRNANLLHKRGWTEQAGRETASAQLHAHVHHCCAHLPLLQALHGLTSTVKPRTGPQWAH